MRRKAKTAPSRCRDVEPDDMRREYKLEYNRARSNRFAAPAGGRRVVVVLDPDISEVFTTPEAVKEVLRALIATMPARPKPKNARAAAGKR